MTHFGGSTRTRINGSLAANTNNRRSLKPSGTLNIREQNIVFIILGNQSSGNTLYCIRKINFEFTNAGSAPGNAIAISKPEQLGGALTYPEGLFVRYSYLLV